MRPADRLREELERDLEARRRTNLREWSRESFPGTAGGVALTATPVAEPVTAVPAVNLSARGGQFTITIAASNATAISKAKADLLAEGVDDHLIYEVAVTALVAAGIPGRIVLSEGDFFVDPGELVVLPQFTLAGSGVDTTRVHNQGAGAATDALVLVDTEAELSDLAFYTDSSYVGRVVQTSHGRVRNIRHSGLAAVGVWVNETFQPLSDWELPGTYSDAAVVVNGAGSVMSNLHLLGAGVGMRITSQVSAVTTITGIVISHLAGQGAGIVMTNPFELRLSDFVIITPDDPCILVDDQTPARINISGGVLRGSHGITGTDFFTIDDSKFSDLLIFPTVRGIDVFSRRCVWRDITIDHPGEHGFRLEGFNNELDGIRVWEPGGDLDDTWDGIIIDGASSHRNYVHGCRVFGMASGNQPRYGINVAHADAECNVVVGNHLGPAADYGSGLINDNGTDTQLAYPNDPTLGDNFGDCPPGSP